MPVPVAKVRHENMDTRHEPTGYIGGAPKPTLHRHSASGKFIPPDVASVKIK
jgi:hypothetical protein